MQLLMRKDFPLANELNNFIRQTSESGLIEKWLKRYRSQEQENIYIEYSRFSTESYYMIYGIYVFTSFLSTSILALEIVIKKNLKKINSSRLWRYLEMYIDPYRYFFSGHVRVVQINSGVFL